MLMVNVMVIYSHDWTNIGFSFILITVNLFRHPTSIKFRLYTLYLTMFLSFIGKKSRNQNTSLGDIGLPQLRKMDTINHCHHMTSRLGVK